MASLTRNRSIPRTVPNEDNLEYYTQRARGGAGMILSEGTLICHQGTEWPHAAGLWEEEHVEAWKKITDAVHKEGVPIVCQVSGVEHGKQDGLGTDERSCGILDVSPTRTRRSRSLRGLPCMRPALSLRVVAK
jgi:2,4-dienoyl-CoA reductase-like NADH-dependent reductase (Old Yellow Enzyme family)